jgi:hypothetical protein
MSAPTYRVRLDNASKDSANAKQEVVSIASAKTRALHNG